MKGAIESLLFEFLHRCDQMARKTQVSLTKKSPIKTKRRYQPTIDMLRDLLLACVGELEEGRMGLFELGLNAAGCNPGGEDSFTKEADELYDQITRFLRDLSKP
jgi:hypothetical protein